MKRQAGDRSSAPDSRKVSSGYRCLQCLQWTTVVAGHSLVGLLVTEGRPSCQPEPNGPLARTGVVASRATARIRCAQNSPRGIVSVPVPVAELALKFSPMPRIAPRLGNEIDGGVTEDPHAVRVADGAVKR